MSRAKHVQDLMEGFYILQQRMLAKHNPVSGISNVTFSQWRVLEAVDRAEKATIKEIHGALGITSSAATQLVNELARKKYVSRKTDPKDGRASHVALTPKAKSMLKTLKSEQLKRTLELFGALNDREFEEYIKLNKKIIESI